MTVEELKSNKPSEVYLLCHTDVLGGKTTVICAYSSMPPATKAMYELARAGGRKDTGYYVKSVELKR